MGVFQFFYSGQSNDLKILKLSSLNLILNLAILQNLYGCLAITILELELDKILLYLTVSKLKTQNSNSKKSIKILRDVWFKIN